MMKLVVLYPDQPNIEIFKQYYLEKHLPLTRKIPGILAMRHSFDVHTLAGEASLACIFEADFYDEASMEAGLSSPEGQEVAADVSNFAQAMPTILQYAISD